MIRMREKNRHIKRDIKSFETVEQSKCLETTVTYKKSIHEEINMRLKSRNACYHTVQNLSTSSLLYKNIKIEMYRNVILL
jgi:hypothetical protein